MDAGYLKQITHYFRMSVIDSERMVSNVKALHQAIIPLQFSKVKEKAPFAIPTQYWLEGKLPFNLAKDIFSAAKVKNEIKSITILFFPRVDLHKYSSGEVQGESGPIIVPLVVQVCLMRDGNLKPSPLAPYIPRNFLAPNQSDQKTFADVDVIDTFLTLNVFKASSWHELLCYCGKLIKAATLNDPWIEDDENDAQNLWLENLHDDYLLKTGFSLVQLETPIIAGFHIRKVLDAILEKGMANKLYQKYISPNNSDKNAYISLKDSISHSKKHFAQMTNEFPLAKNQRNVLHYLSDLENGAFLAINGPPGTGKTTLLRSVVANMWVEAALNKKAPPLIAAVSSNNQAVTNIIECFAKVSENHINETLQGRWLPGLSTYGIYACGKDKAHRNNPFPYITKQGVGLMAQMENDEYIVKAKEHFLACFNRWRDMPEEVITCIKEASDILHLEMSRLIGFNTKLLELFQKMKTLNDEIECLYGDESGLIKHLRKQKFYLNALATQRATKKQWFNEFLMQWQERRIWGSIFSFVPFIKTRRNIRNEILASGFNIELAEYTDLSIREYFETQNREYAAREKEAMAILSQGEELHQLFINTKVEFDDMLSQLGDTKYEMGEDFTYFSNELDCYTRFPVFKLATHYWEAEWLLEVSESQSKIKSPLHLIQRYQRYAKLTPCMVATFNMLPNFFSLSEKNGDAWRCLPMFDALDLLIIEEAGQALPHMAAASMALAKKALVIGDIEQIEPVWSLGAGIDRANLSRFGLLNQENVYERFWLPSALLASSGNFMKVIHRHVKEQQLIELNPGLYLTEHRRCYNEIIVFCNELVYHGHLEPCRGEAKKNTLLPPMGFIHHNSTSQIQGSSRVNQAEAECIAQWIKDNQTLLFSTGRRSLAVITPFFQQKLILQRTLGRYGLQDISVGTIHTFQGAEKNIIIFSSVYGSNNFSGSKFYDANTNMLNVAVSRAKNHFIVFGHGDVFGMNQASLPSSLLRSFLSDIDSVGKSERFDFILSGESKSYAMSSLSRE